MESNPESTTNAAAARQTESGRGALYSIPVTTIDGQPTTLEPYHGEALLIAHGAREQKPIELERTSVTGLRHIDGTLSMARGGPDSATSSFFICIGNQPALDFGGHRNLDGQGFAAFGRVTRGMDVVRKIQASAAEAQRLTPPVTITRIVRIP